ncbi:MAG: SH3 domain-containing protein [Lachnospiraceae bacterium]
MKRFIKKTITTALLAATVCMSVLPVSNFASAEDGAGLTAGVSAVLSLNLDREVASVVANNVKATTASENDTDPMDEINPAVIGTDEDGNTTICGYTNLGIAVVDGNLNVRKTPSTKGRIVGKMTNHAGCEILKEKDDWVKIKSGKVKGWVSKEYLLTGEEALAEVNDAINHIAKVTTDNLRVRSKASTESKVITRVSKGEKLEIKKVEDDWIKVDINGDTGYISADYATEQYSLDEAMTLTELSAGKGVSDVRVALVQEALKYVGGRYVWGGTNLSTGVDCSGFTMCIFGKFGYSLPHYSGAQAGYGTSISASEAKPGDLFFYGSGRSIGHVAIYIGNGQIVHAASSRTGIVIGNAYYRTPVKVVRIIQD